LEENKIDWSLIMWSMISKKKNIIWYIWIWDICPYQLVFYKFKIFISCMPISSGEFFLVQRWGRKFLWRRFGDRDNFIICFWRFSFRTFYANNIYEYIYLYFYMICAYIICLYVIFIIVTRLIIILYFLFVLWLIFVYN
jgi:hypothetical protein